MKNKYFYPIFKLKTKSWIRYWLLKKTEFKGKLSDILTGFSFNLQNTLRQKFVKFEREGHSIQDGTPSPENEVPIKSAGENGSITEKIATKNLLEITENTGLARCTYVSGANTNQYKLLCTAADMYFNEVKNAGLSWNIANGNLIPCKQGETLYFDVGNPLFTGCYFTEYDKNLKSLGYRGINSSSGTYTATNINCAFVTFRGGYGRNAEPGTTYTLAPIVSKTPIDSYVPHKEQTYTIPTQQPFRSIGDVRDCFVKKSDGWYERHNINRKVFDGTENWQVGANGTNSYYVYLGNASINEDTVTVLCNFFKGVKYNDRATAGNNIIYINSANNTAYIRNTSITSLNDFKAWLVQLNTNGNPLYIDYLLTTPIDLPCTQSQIDILENLPITFEGQTNVYSTDEVEPFLKIQYWESDTNG